ncbi:MAG: hypothetical protein E5V34_00020 [Mesorhizobium sp.]|nr:MAG: hypothetical protein E5V34_00020 [Mesorhizobium sp.]
MRSNGAITPGATASGNRVLVRPDNLVAIGRIAGGTVAENHSLIWALEGSAGALLSLPRRATTGDDGRHYVTALDIAVQQA